ncbi:MAG: DUF2971 domain-containing protein [Deltaproteobacteria bacterium]|nr:DUF2971 domain-containing protein [Deltaproteobacteria bacterium]
MTTPNQNSVSPPVSEVWFCFKSQTLFKLPSFLFLNLIADSRPNAKKNKKFDRLSCWADDLPKDQNDREIVALIKYLQTNVPWRDLSRFVTVSADSNAHIDRMWKGKRNTLASYRIEIHQKELPPELYRYEKLNQKRLERLFTAGELFLSSPSSFNDPFDCSFDEETRSAFIGCGMKSLCAERNNILMFSHYADNHQGVCLGFEPVQLAKSMSNQAESIVADIRPVWYFNKMPPIGFKSEPALCATCKDEVWSYEKEYRLFLAKSGSLLPVGSYSFSPEALQSVVFGCRATHESIAFVKSISRDIRHLKYYKALREPNQFCVKLLEIPKL